MSLADSIRNFYERMVVERVLAVAPARVSGADEGVMADIACIALNKLPPRYVRYEVDASFYLTSRQRDEIDRQVSAVVEEAISFVLHNSREDA